MIKVWGSLFLFLIIIFNANFALAGAWTQKAGEGQLISQATYYTASGGFDGNGLPLSGDLFTKAELSFYIEYGLTDQWTIGAQPRLQYIRSAGPGFDAERFASGDWDFFLRRQVVRKGRYAVSAQGLLKVGEAYSMRSPASGNGAQEVEARVAFGRSIGRSWLGEGFVDVAPALRWRSGGYADQVRLDGTLGWTVPRMKGQVLAEVHNTFGVGVGKADYDLTRVQITHVRPVWRRLSAQIGGYREIAGRGIAQGNGAILGFWFEF